MIVVLLVLVALLAFANGSNDNGKGVATLVGYGAASSRTALLWAAASTAAGAVVSVWLAPGLLKTFNSGLFVASTPLAGNYPFFVAVVLGAFGWVILATRTGMPVSTTHAIVGALTGAGLVAFGRATFQWSFLGWKIALPLAISPLLSLAIVYVLVFPVIWIIARTARRMVVTTERVAISVTEPMLVASGSAAGTDAPRGVVVDYRAERTEARTVQVSPAANAVHWASGGMIGFARGWNDTPKIAALALVAMPSNKGMAFALVTVAMAAGGLIAGRRVLDTLANKVTALPLPESLTASLAGATLVAGASWFAFPVSTTHVITGGIIGGGLASDPRGVRWKKVGEIVLSWVVSLPVAAIIAALAMVGLRMAGK